MKIICRLEWWALAREGINGLERAGVWLEKGYDCPWELFSLVCSFDKKIVSRCQCMWVSQHKPLVRVAEKQSKLDLLLHCLLKQTAIKQLLCKYRTRMEFSTLLESVYFSKPAHFRGSTHASFLRKNFTVSTWNFQWKQPAQSPRQPVCQGTYLGCERSRVLAPRKTPLERRDQEHPNWGKAIMW